MKPELRKEIEEFFDSIGDELAIDELTNAFYDANTLLRKVLDDDAEPKYIVPKDFGNFYVEKSQFWAGTHTAAVYTKEEADAIVEAERKRYNLKGTHGPYAVKLVPDQVQFIEDDFPMDDPRLTDKQKEELYGKTN